MSMFHSVKLVEDLIRMTYSSSSSEKEQAEAAAIDSSNPFSVVASQIKPPPTFWTSALVQKFFYKLEANELQASSKDENSELKVVSKQKYGEYYN